MIGLNAYVLVNGNWVDASAILANSTGTPVVSATANFDGRAIADSYALAFSSVVAGVSATVKVTCGSVSNPYNNQVGVSVNLDGTTVYSEIIPGVDLVFSSSGSFTGSWQASVIIGNPFGQFNAFPPDSGDPSTAIRVKVLNSGAASAGSCKARLLPVVKRVKRTGIVFAVMHSIAEGAIEKLIGSQVAPYGLVAFNVAGSGPAKTMDVDIDGAPFNVINLTDSTTGSSVGLNVIDFYRATSGPLTGMEFKLSQNAAEADTENVLCFSHRFSQIATDQDGIPGDWGITDVNLTESGQATGVITASGIAYFWVRVLVVDGSNSSSNPYVVDVALQGATLLAAGWEDEPIIPNIPLLLQSVAITPTDPKDLVVASGETFVVATIPGERHLFVYDATDFNNLDGDSGDEGSGQPPLDRMFKLGNIVLWTAGFGTVIFDVTTPSAPSVFSNGGTGGTDVWAVGTSYFAPNPNTDSVFSVDITTPGSPSDLDELDTSALSPAIMNPWACEGDVTELYVVNQVGAGSFYLLSVDISTPATLAKLDSVVVDTADGDSHEPDVVVHGNYAYVLSQHKIYVVNISNPSAMSLVGSVTLDSDTGARTYRGQVVSDTLVVAIRNPSTADSTSRVKLFDILADPTVPSLMATITPSASATAAATGVFVSGTTLYLATRKLSGGSNSDRALEAWDVTDFIV